jgi:hypothetical protein
MSAKKKYGYISAILCVLLGIVLLSLWKRRTGDETPHLLDNGSNPPEQSGKSGGPSETVDPKPTMASQTSQETNRLPTTFDYVTETLKDPVYDWKQPINFYGKVVDENEQPVEGAAAHFKWTDLSANGTSEYQTVSDAAGLFAMENQKGKRLSVTVSKAGYYSAADARLASFEYANPYDGKFTPDPNRPVILHLRKKGDTELLLTRNVRFIVPHGETPSGFDPVRCKMSPDGPMLFALSAIATNEFQATHLRLQIQIRGGGIQIAEGEFAFEAPEDGYQVTLEFGNAEVPLNQWPSELQCYFYFGEPRRYGRLQFSRSVLGGRVGVDRSLLVLTCWINESSSRNLEYEPGKFVQPTPEYYLRPNTPLIDSLRSPQ